ncbi:MAG: hypothetical protein R2825_13240 [Saprospiraceae bacterium]
MAHKGHPLFNDYKYERVVKGTIFGKYKQFVENTFKVMPRHALVRESWAYPSHHQGGNVVYDRITRFNVGVFGSVAELCGGSEDEVDVGLRSICLCD